MQKITYENYSNGLSVTFSNDNPRAFLANFDGSSTPCTAIAYKPAEFDGQRFVSANLDARTITFTAEWYGVSNGKLSPKKSYDFWEELQRIFVPGQMGKLTWTNGYKTRFIECRAAETPNFSRVCGPKLSAEFRLVADYPYWKDIAEHSYEFTGVIPASKSINLTNSCGIAVPFVFTCTHPHIALVLYTDGLPNITLNEGDFSGAVMVDTRKCLVTIDGEPANQHLSPRSSFFKLPPGDFELRILNVGASSISAGTRLTWHDHYLGVG